MISRWISEAPVDAQRANVAVEALERMPGLERSAPWTWIAVSTTC